MDNKIKVTTESGQVLELEVLDIFSVAGYEGKDYILYTQGEETPNHDIKTYVSILENIDGNYSLKEITNPEELTLVHQAIEEAISMGDE